MNYALTQMIFPSTRMYKIYFYEYVHLVIFPFYRGNKRSDDGSQCTRSRDLRSATPEYGQNTKSAHEYRTDDVDVFLQNQK